MLEITIPESEAFDEATSQFFVRESVTIQLEHSLVSLSKWEAEWEKPFLGKQQKTTEEALGYIRAMTITPGVPVEVYSRLSSQNMNDIDTYINARMSATWFAEPKKSSAAQETITAELIYYWMSIFTIPKECETWHLNRLFTLIKVANEKNKPQKKLSARELAARNAQMNEERLKRMGGRG